MEKEKQAFLMYYSYRKKLDMLSDEEVRKILNAIFNYEITGTAPELSTVATEIVWLFIKDNLDRDKKTYWKRINANRENSKKGGAPKGNKNAIKQPKSTQFNPIQPKQPDNENERENEYDNEDDNDTVNEREEVTALFSPSLILDEPIKLLFEQYEQLASRYNTTKWLQQNYRHISKLHKYYDKVISGYYDQYDTGTSKSNSAETPVGHGQAILNALKEINEND